MPHRGDSQASATLKKIYGDNAITSKGVFSDKVYNNYREIINLLKKGNDKAANKLSKDTQKYINDMIKNKPSFAFIIDAPHQAHKTGSKYNDATFISEISLLPKNLQTKANELIKRVEYVPEMFKSDLKGEAKIIQQLEKLQ